MSKDLPNLEARDSESNKNASTLKTLQNEVDCKIEAPTLNNNRYNGDTDSHVCIMNGTSCAARPVCCGIANDKDGRRNLSNDVNMDTHNENRMGICRCMSDAVRQSVQVTSGLHADSVSPRGQNNLGSLGEPKPKKIHRCFSDGMLGSREESDRQQCVLNGRFASDTCMCVERLCQTRNNIPVSPAPSPTKHMSSLCNENEEKALNNTVYCNGTSADTSTGADSVLFPELVFGNRSVHSSGLNSPRTGGHRGSASGVPRTGGHRDSASGVPRTGGHRDSASGVPRTGGHRDSASGVPRTGGHRDSASGVRPKTWSQKAGMRKKEHERQVKPKPVCVGTERLEKGMNQLQVQGDRSPVNNCNDDACDICDEEMSMIFGSPMFGTMQNGYDSSHLAEQASGETDRTTGRHASPRASSDSYPHAPLDSVRHLNDETLPSSQAWSVGDPSSTGRSLIVVAPLALPEDISDYETDESCDENCSNKPRACDIDNTRTQHDTDCDRSTGIGAAVRSTGIGVAVRSTGNGAAVRSEVEPASSLNSSPQLSLMDSLLAGSACALPNLGNSSHCGQLPVDAALLCDREPCLQPALGSSGSPFSVNRPSRQGWSRRSSSVESLEEVGDYIEADLPPRSERLAFFSRGSSSSTTTDEDEGCGDEVLPNRADEDSDNETIDPLVTSNNAAAEHYSGMFGAACPPLWPSVVYGDRGDVVYGDSGGGSGRSQSYEVGGGRGGVTHASSGDTDCTGNDLVYSMSDLSQVTSTDAESGMECVFPSASTSSSGSAFLQSGFQGEGCVGGQNVDSVEGFHGNGHHVQESASFYLPRQTLSFDHDTAGHYQTGASVGRSRSLDQDLALSSSRRHVSSNLRSFNGEKRSVAMAGSNFQKDKSNLQEKVFEKGNLEHPGHVSCSSDEEESNSSRQLPAGPDREVVAHPDTAYSRYDSQPPLEFHRAVLAQIPDAAMDPNIVLPEEEPIYEDIDDLQLSEGMFCSDSEPDNNGPVRVPCSTSFKKKRRRTGSPVSDVKKVMIWNEYEAFVVQVKQIGTSTCGPTSILNVLKAFDFQVDAEEVSQSITYNSRMEAAPVPYYLFSRSSAGTTAEALVMGVSSLTRGAIKGRFFHFYPQRDVQLLKWLGDWIEKGAVPVATLNLQQGVKPGWTIPDAWHHQMVYGVSHKGVYLTNPLEIVPETVLMEQLTSDSVLLVRRQDIVSRFRDWCPLNEILKQRDPKWRTMNVLGQVVHVLRESCTVREQVAGVRAQLTSHVKIPTVYKAGFILFMRTATPGYEELMRAPEVPLKHPDSLPPPPDGHRR